MNQEHEFTFDLAQETQQRLCKGLSIETNTQEALIRLTEELNELTLAVTNHDTQGVASELGDIVTLASIIAIQYGFLLGEAVQQKLARNEQKYPPQLRDDLLASGIPPEEIFPMLKERWDKERDNEFLVHVSKANPV